MEKSIENIWKQGFIQSDALVAPKLNDLYNQKSTHLVDKFKRMGRVNMNAIIAGAFFLLLSFTLAGVPVVGAVIFLLLIGLVFVGKKQGKALEAIDKGDSSYQYLSAFDTWLKASVSEYSKIYKFFYPLFFLAFILGGLYTDVFQSVMDERLIDKIMNNPDTYMVLGLPAFWVLSILVFLGLSSYASGAIYRFDLKIVYGRVFNKLEELLNDMEELRK